MKEKMTTEQFVKAYAENLLQGLIDGRISYKYLSFECDFCPLRELCDKEAEEAGYITETCEEFFQKKLSDGFDFRLR